MRDEGAAADKECGCGAVQYSTVPVTVKNEKIEVRGRCSVGCDV